MKLNYDCVRSLLIALEEHLQYGENLENPRITIAQVSTLDIMSDFDFTDIAYSSEKLLEADFIDARIVRSDSGIVTVFYFSISFEGHQYLDAIRSDTVWNRLKKMFVENSVSMTFDLIKSTAPKVATLLLGL